MKTKLIFNTLLFLLITNFVYTQNLIVGEWKKIDTCPDGNSIIQNFKDDGTGTVIVPDCNKVCAPYYYKYEFLWSTSGSKLTVNYQSVAEYCGKKAPVPPTDVMDYEVSENNLRIVQDRYVRNGSSSEKQNSSTNAKVELANKISEEYNLAPEHSELLQIIASSNSKEELLSKLKAKNQELYTETAMKAVNKLFGNSNIDLPISISEMTQIANGNIEEAINQINRNADISRITEGFGGNEVLANQLYDGMQMTIDAIDEKWEEKAEEKAQEFVNYTKQFKISNNRSSSSKKFEYRANFLDENWKFYKNDFIQITEYDSLKINVNIKKKN
ncbi:hypothetical protein [Mesoflavibacter sp. CH_XMU1422-2]|uniref:hypothetical protein n=1 Tax=Mesoflavibacter sp. CH_XMU1422-2 TaxID=3107770 RepID=UPI00300877AD